LEFTVGVLSAVRDLGQLAGELTLASHVMGVVVEWYGRNTEIQSIERFGIKMQWLTARASIGGRDVQKPPCFGNDDYLDKRTKLCRACAFLGDCEPVARPKSAPPFRSIFAEARPVRPDDRLANIALDRKDPARNGRFRG